MEYQDIKASQCVIKFVGSIKLDYNIDKSFLRDAHQWDNIAHKMGVAKDALSIEKLSDAKRSEMKTIFYEGVINAVFPATGKDVVIYNIAIDKPIKLYKECDKTILVERIRLYFFPHNIMVFSLECNCGQKPFNDITNYIYTIRDLEKYDILNDDFLVLFTPLLSLYNCCSESKSKIALYDYSPDNVRKYNTLLHKANKLKCYTVAQIDEDSQSCFNRQYTCNHLLFEIGCASPIGCSVDASHHQKPSQQYFDKIISQNTISCFENWTGLSLIDSFTCLYNKKTSNFFIETQWGEWYFLYLYINVYYTKIFMLDINDQFRLSNKESKIFNTINKFNRQFNHYNVSYNFLPDIIHKNMRQGMELDEEYDAVKEEIKNYEEREDALREKRLNTFIFVLTLLTIASFLNDGWEFILKIIALFK